MNDSPSGQADLICIVDGLEYELPTPEEVGKVLRDAAWIDTSDIVAVKINGADAPFSQLVSNGDVIEVIKQAPTEGSVVYCGRLSDKMWVVDFAVGDSIMDVLVDKGYSIEVGEAVLLNGEFVDEDDHDDTYPRNGDTIIIVPTNKSGNRIKFLLI